MEESSAEFRVLVPVGEESAPQSVYDGGRDEVEVLIDFGSPLECSQVEELLEFQDKPSESRLSDEVAVVLEVVVLEGFEEVEVAFIEGVVEDQMPHLPLAVGEMGRWFIGSWDTPH